MAAPALGKVVFPFNIGASDNAPDEEMDPSKVMRRVQNVRLTPGGRGYIEKPPSGGYLHQITNDGTMPICHGIAPHGAQDLAAMYFRPKYGQQRVMGPTTPDESLPNTVALASTNTSATQQNAFFPIVVRDAGALPQGADSVVAVNGHYRWSLGARGNSVYVSVQSDAGVVVAPTLITTATLLAWMHITSHGAQGMIAWVYDSSAGKVSATQLTYSAGAIGIGSTVLVSTLQMQMPAATGDDTYAYLVTRHASTTTSVVVTRINVNLMTTSSFTLSSWTSGSGGFVYASACFAQVAASGSAVRYLGLTVLDNSVTSATAIGVLNGDTMSAVWTSTNQYTSSPDIPARVACAFRATGDAVTSSSNAHLVIARQATATSAYVGFEFRQIVGGFNEGTTKQYLMQLASPGASWKADTSGTVNEIYALFALARFANVADQSVAIVVAHKYSDTTRDVSPIGRFGCLESSVSSLLAIGFPCSLSVDLPLNDTCDLVLAYNVIDGAVNSRRFAVLDMRGQQPAVASSNGAALICGALPAFFDGVQTAEQGFTHAPVMSSVSTSGGSGTALPGQTRYRALYRYTNGEKKAVRSGCSVGYLEYTTGNKPQINVQAPWSLRNGVHQDDVTVELYSTYWNGSSMSQDYYLITSLSSSSATAGLVQFNNCTASDGTGEILYSQGTGREELLPDPIGPLFDAEWVGDRIVAVSAEYRDRIYLSKRMSSLAVGQAQVAPEFSQYLTVTFPQNSGRLMAARTFQGACYALSENAIYVVHGEGPDNTGQNGAFSQPQLVAPIGCMCRESVVVTPVGILFAARTERGQGRWALLGPEGLNIFTDVTYTQPLGSVVYSDASEVAFAVGDLNNGAISWKVFNWKLGQWCEWTSLPCAFYTPVRGHGSAWAYVTTRYAGTPSIASAIIGITPAVGAPGGLAFYVSPLWAQMSYETPWIEPLGPHGDLAWTELFLTLQNIGTGQYGLTITVDFDWDQAGEGPAPNSRTETWLAADLAAISGQNSLGRYTLALDLNGKQGRAAKVTITEVNSNTLNVQPIQATLYFRANPAAPYRGALVQKATR